MDEGPYQSKSQTLLAMILLSMLERMFIAGLPAP